MDSRCSRRGLLRRGALVTSVGLTGCGTSLLGPSPEERVRQYEEDLRPLADLGTAIERGYRTLGRYGRGEEGVSGVPLIDRRVTSLDPTRPHAVLYGLTENGEYEPFGLKWFVDATNRSDPPTLFGRKFDGPFEANPPSIPRHYALHVWLFRDNPEGLFAPFNPSIEPPSYLDEISPVYDRLADFALGSAAERAGYRNTEKCIVTPDGGYGVPFVRTGDDARGGTDPENPPILLYRVTSNWIYRLLGAEWYVPVTERDAPPRLFGQRFHEPAAKHSPRVSQSDHYGLHAWLFRANPRGMFATYNPKVTC